MASKKLGARAIDSNFKIILFKNISLFMELTLQSPYYAAMSKPLE